MVADIEHSEDAALILSQYTRSRGRRADAVDKDCDNPFHCNNCPRYEHLQYSKYSVNTKLRKCEHAAIAPPVEEVGTVGGLSLEWCAREVNRSAQLPDLSLSGTGGPPADKAGCHRAW